MDIRKMLDILNKAPYGVYAVDMEQRIVFWNSEAERILGHRAKNRLEAITSAQRLGLLPAANS